MQASNLFDILVPSSPIIMCHHVRPLKLGSLGICDSTLKAAIICFRLDHNRHHLEDRLDDDDRLIGAMSSPTLVQPLTSGSV